MREILLLASSILSVMHGRSSCDCGQPTGEGGAHVRRHSQGRAKAGMAEELARKEGAIPIISDVEGFMAYYVVYAPDDTVTAISIFNNLRERRSRTDAGSRGSNRTSRLCSSGQPRPSPGRRSCIRWHTTPPALRR